MRNRWLVFVILLIMLIAVFVLISRFEREEVENPETISVLSDSAETVLKADVGDFSKTIADSLLEKFKSIKNIPAKIYRYYFDNTFNFEQISFVTTDKKKNYYFIDKSQQRIVIMDSDYHVRFNMEAKSVIGFLKKNKDIVKNVIGKIDESHMTAHAQKIVVCPDNDYFFVLYRISLDNKTINEVIVRYYKNYKYGHLYFIHKNQNQCEWVKNIRDISVNKDKLYITVKEPDSKVLYYPLGSIFVNNIITEDMPEQNNKNVLISQDKGDINQISTDGKSFCFTTMQGEVWMGENGDNRWIEKVPKTVLTDNGKSLYPYFVERSNRGYYFVDMAGQKIYILSRTNDGYSLEKLPINDDSTTGNIIKINSIYEDGGIVCSVITQETRSEILILNSRGSFHIRSAHYSTMEMAFRWLTLISILVLLCLTFFIIRYIYFELMQKKLKMIVKQALLNIFLLVVGIYIVSQVTYVYVSSQIEQKEDQKLILMAKLVSGFVSNDKDLNEFSEDYDFDRTLELSKKVKNFVMEDTGIQEGQSFDDSKPYIEKSLYVALYKVDGERYCHVVDTDNEYIYLPLEANSDEKKGYKDVWGGYKPFIVADDMDSTGEWKYALTRIMDSNGQPVGICEVGVNVLTYKNSLKALESQILWVIFAIIFVIIMIMILAFIQLFKRLDTLNYSVGEIAKGNWDLEVPVDGNDEVADLSRNIKIMCQKIKKYISDIVKMNESYYRFVPKQYQNYLKRDSILDVHLGDQVEKNMSIVITSIRSFTALTDGMTPQESFNFINTIIGYTCPAVRENKGFVDKYSGIGIMALFPENPIDATNAAIETKKRIFEYNRSRLGVQDIPVELDIAVHTGPMMLGIIGEEERLEGAVISDNVSLTTILGTISGHLGADIVMTGETLALIKNHDFLIRHLGLFRFKGRNEPVELFDLFEADTKEQRELKLITKEEFEAGVQHYQGGRFCNAREAFINVIKDNKDDKAAKIYFLLADEYFKTGAPDGWDGTIDGKII